MQADKTRFSLPIRLKIPLALVGLSLLMAVLVLSMAYFTVRDQALQDAKEEVVRIANAEKDAITRWFDDIGADAVGLAANPTVSKSLQQLRSSLVELGDGGLDQLREVYITNNPYPLGQRAKLVKADVRGGYHFRHEGLHKYFDTIVTEAGYYDIFLITTEGDVLYTHAKEDDYATNMLTGPYAQTELANVFVKATTLAPGEVAVLVNAPWTVTFTANVNCALAPASRAGIVQVTFCPATATVPAVTALVR